VDANFATDAAFQIDFAKTLQILELVVLLNLEDAIDRADFQAGLAPGAIIGIDDRQFLRQLFSWTLFCHEMQTAVNSQWGMWNGG
jgi:hypothetical protein